MPGTLRPVYLSEKLAKFNSNILLAVEFLVFAEDLNARIVELFAIVRFCQFRQGLGHNPAVYSARHFFLLQNLEKMRPLPLIIGNKIVEKTLSLLKFTRGWKL